MAKQLQDGSYVLLRKDRVEEAKLDREMIRCKGQMRWYPKNLGKDIEGLEIKETHAYIVGKGVSLDELNLEYFNPDSIIICINESIHKVETLGLKNRTFVLQQDAQLKERCQPKNAEILLSVHSKNFYKDKWIYVPENYALASNSLSVICAIEILKRKGIKDFTFLCFDACVNGVTSYASTIGYSASIHGDPKRFLGHRATIEEHLQGCTYDFVIPKGEKYDVSICAIVKDEVDYVEEWIEYHRLIGVSHFYIYNNGCTDGTLFKLKPYLESGIVTIIPWPQYPAQVEAYQHCLTTYSYKSKWISFTDVDEFFVIKSGLSLPVFLNDYLEFAGLAVHWVFFGSNGESEKKPDFVIERFTKRQTGTDGHVKTIVNCAYSNQMIYNHSHLPKSTLKIVDENKNPVTRPIQDGTSNKIQLNHYFTKSKEEFIQKVNKGRVDIIKKRSYSEFDPHDKNEVVDLFASAKAGTIKQQLKPDITLITATGDRPEAFKLCEKWIKNQNFAGRIQWIVVDDGVTPTKTTLGQSYVRRNRQPEDPAHTLIPNLRVAFSLVKSDYVFFVEDDDYYAPNYLSIMFEYLKKKALVGLQKARYYNIKEKRYRELRNEEHSSLCSTAIAKPMFEIFKKCLESDNPCVDLRLFRDAEVHLPRTIHLFESSLVVGVKGMPGRKGLLKGHNPDDSYLLDADLKVLKAWIPNDYIDYIPIGQ